VIEQAADVAFCPTAVMKIAATPSKWQCSRVTKKGEHSVMQAIEYRSTRDISLNGLLTLYKANGWSAADKPDLLRKALLNSETLISAWDVETLVGLGNAISDGHLVVYYPHLLVLPEYHARHRQRNHAAAQAALLRVSPAHAGG